MKPEKLEAEIMKLAPDLRAELAEKILLSLEEPSVSAPIDEREECAQNGMVGQRLQSFGGRQDAIPVNQFAQ
jgi:hypothetical protein